MTDDLRLLLSRAARRASRDYRARLSQFDLSPAQATALLILGERPGITLRDLADSLSSDQPTTSAMVDRLMLLGLVRRETDPDDRRRARLLPSDPAQEVIERLAEARRATNNLILQALGHEQAKELSYILGRLLAGLDELTETAQRPPSC